MTWKTRFAQLSEEEMDRAEIIFVFFTMVLFITLPFIAVLGVGYLDDSLTPSGVFLGGMLYLMLLLMLLFRFLPILPLFLFGSSHATTESVPDGDGNSKNDVQSEEAAKQCPKNKNRVLNPIAKRDAHSRKHIGKNQKAEA
jgi:hypothetical protein